MSNNKRISQIIFCFIVLLFTRNTIAADKIFDGFDSNDGVFITSEKESWSVTNGRLFFKNPNGKAGLVDIIFTDYSQDINYMKGNFSAAVYASSEGGDQGYVYGLQAFCIDQESGNITDDTRIAVTPGIYRIDKKNGTGKVIVDWTQSLLVKGDMDLLEIERNNDILNFYINNQKVATENLESCPVILLGLFSSENVESSFDNFQIYPGSTLNIEEPVASYTPETETLYLPRVDVGVGQYKAKLKLVDTSPLSFKLIEATPIELGGSNNSSFTVGLLNIPVVEIPNEAGFDTYNANLNLIPDTNPIEFKLNKAEITGSNYSEHTVSIASAVIESYMKNARDTIVSFKVDGGVIKYDLFRYKTATQELVNGSIAVLASGGFASMETYASCKSDVTSLECVTTIEKIISGTLTGLGAGILCAPAGPYAAVVCSTAASKLTASALDKAYNLAFDAGVFAHKVVETVNNTHTEIYNFGVSIHRSDLGKYLEWVARCGILGNICSK